jgi:hypothetical protein
MALLSGETVRTIGSATTIAVALVGVIWYVAGLETRVRQLEIQVHTLTVAPIIAAPGAPIAGADKPAAAVPNPVAQKCADLASDAVRYAAQPNSSAVTEAENMMKTLGCGKTAP